jgi:hypothetical protein
MGFSGFWIKELSVVALSTENEENRKESVVILGSPGYHAAPPQGNVHGGVLCH